MSHFSHKHRAGFLDGLLLVEAPGAWPVSLRYAKDHLRIPDTWTQDDLYILQLIRVATDAVQAYQDRVYMPHIGEMSFTHWREFFELYGGRVPSVISVKYLDEDANLVELPDTEWRLWNSNIPARLQIPGSTFPRLAEGEPDPIRIRYRAGQGVKWTVNPDTNIITAPGHDFIDDNQVQLASTNNLPAPLEREDLYWVFDVQGDEFKLSREGDGQPFDITDKGAGIHYATDPLPNVQQSIVILVAHLYKAAREAVAVGKSVNLVDWSWKWLADQEKIPYVV